MTIGIIIFILLVLMIACSLIFEAISHFAKEKQRRDELMKMINRAAEAKKRRETARNGITGTNRSRTPKRYSAQDYYVPYMPLHAPPSIFDVSGKRKAPPLRKTKVSADSLMEHDVENVPPMPKVKPPKEEVSPGTVILNALKEGIENG